MGPAGPSGDERGSGAVLMQHRRRVSAPPGSDSRRECAGEGQGRMKRAPPVGAVIKAEDS